MRCTMNCLVQRQLIIALIWGHMHTELTLNPILSANGKVHFRVDLINIARPNGQSGEHHWRVAPSPFICASSRPTHIQTTLLPSGNNRIHI